MGVKKRKRKQAVEASQAQPAISMNKVVGKQHAKEGDPAPAGRRFFAYLIDWYLGALATALPISIVAGALTGDITNQRLVDFPAPYGIAAGALALLFACAYYIAIPLAGWRGQTPGKRICRIRIEMADGSPADLAHLALRQVVGVFILSGVIANASSIWHQMLTIATQVNFVHPLMYAGFAVTVVSCVMILFRKDHRCLHDFIGGTAVRLAPKPEGGDGPEAAQQV